MEQITVINDDIEIFKMLTSFYNISVLYYENGIPQEYVRVLTDLKDKTSIADFMINKMKL